MINRLLIKKLPVYYSPDALVTHTVVPDRRTKKFLIDRMRGDGATQPLLDLDTERFCQTNLLRRILYDLKICIQYYLTYIFRKMTTDDNRSWLHYLYFIQRWGRVFMELRLFFDPEFKPLWKKRWQRLEEIKG